MIWNWLKKEQRVEEPTLSTEALRIAKAIAHADTFKLEPDGVFEITYDGVKIAGTTRSKVGGQLVSVSYTVLVNGVVFPLTAHERNFICETAAARYAEEKSDKVDAAREALMGIEFE